MELLVDIAARSGRLAHAPMAMVQLAAATAAEGTFVVAVASTLTAHAGQARARPVAWIPWPVTPFDSHLTRLVVRGAV